MRLSLFGRRSAAAALALALVGCASAPAPTPGFWTGFRDHPHGYLDAAHAPDASAFLPPPPEAGSLREQDDLAYYRATRALKGTARWDQARADNEIETPSAPRVFDQALGVAFVPERNADPDAAAGADAGRPGDDPDAGQARLHPSAPLRVRTGRDLFRARAVAGGQRLLSVRPFGPGLGLGAGPVRNGPRPRRTRSWRAAWPMATAGRSAASITSATSRPAASSARPCSPP